MLDSNDLTGPIPDTISQLSNLGTNIMNAALHIPCSAYVRSFANLMFLLLLD